MHIDAFANLLLAMTTISNASPDPGHFGVQISSKSNLLIPSTSIRAAPWPLGWTVGNVTLQAVPPLDRLSSVFSGSKEDTNCGVQGECWQHLGDVERILDAFVCMWMYSCIIYDIATWYVLSDHKSMMIIMINTTSSDLIVLICCFIG